MAVVRCRYGEDHPVGPALPDELVWICLGAIGVEDAPGDELAEYHHAQPRRPCSCGFDPLAPVPEPEPDGMWRPGHP